MADVKPATTAVTPASASTPPPRYIPGAPATTTAASKAKSKRKKQTASPTNGIAESPVVTKSETPVALLSQVPSVSDLPAELVGTGSATEVKDESSSRPKSAAEEMVQKRMKLLAKKIVSMNGLTLRDKGSGS